MPQIRTISDEACDCSSLFRDHDDKLSHRSGRRTSGVAATTWHLIVARDCKIPVAYLKANRLADAVWFTMYSQADLLCWQDEFGDLYKPRGLAILDAGLQSNPDSPRLLKLKTEYYEFVGGKVNAERFHRMANNKARHLW
jgi:hypothetical protein